MDKKLYKDFFHKCKNILLYLQKKTFGPYFTFRSKLFFNKSGLKNLFHYCRHLLISFSHISAHLLKQLLGPYFGGEINILKLRIILRTVKVLYLTLNLSKQLLENDRIVTRYKLKEESINSMNQ